MKETQADFGLTAGPAALMELEPRGHEKGLAIEAGGCAPPVYVRGVSRHASEFAARLKAPAPGDTTANAKAPQGLRFNAGKPMLSLIEPSFRTEMGKVLTAGAKKYARDNWKKGIPVQTGILDSLERHYAAFLAGEETDAESGCHHMAHVAVNAMFAYWMMKNRPDMDDRFKSA